MSNIQPGETVLFGKYHIKNGDSLDPIEWIVMEADGDSLLLLSKYVIEAMHYHEVYEETTWERCSLRRWLNWTFYDMAFTAEEKADILQVKNDNRDPHPLTLPVRVPDPTHRSDSVSVDIPGKIESLDTLDKVFLLSSHELEKTVHALGNLPVLPTPYALQKGLLVEHVSDYSPGGYRLPTGTDYCMRWWLRNRGKDADLVCIGYSDNRISTAGYPVFFGETVLEGVRPAIRVKTDACFEE